MKHSRIGRPHYFLLILVVLVFLEPYSRRSPHPGRAPCHLGVPAGTEGRIPPGTVLGRTGGNTCCLDRPAAGAECRTGRRLGLTPTDTQDALAQIENPSQIGL